MKWFLHWWNKDQSLFKGKIITKRWKCGVSLKKSRDPHCIRNAKNYTKTHIYCEDSELLKPIPRTNWGPKRRSKFEITMHSDVWILNCSNYDPSPTLVPKKVFKVQHRNMYVNGKYRYFEDFFSRNTMLQYLRLLGKHRQLVWILNC